MAEEESNRTVETVENIGVSTFQNSLAGVVNGTYTYANSSLFVASIAGYYQDYANRYIRPCAEWLDGFVPSIHNLTTGIMSTHIAGALISGLARQIVGEKLVLRPGSKDKKAFEDLKFVSDWAQKQNVRKAVKMAVGYSLGFGTSLIKLNTRMNGTLWWEGVRFDNCYYLADFSGEVKECETLIRHYADTRPKKDAHFYLCEHRFWAKSKGKIKEVNGQFVVVEEKGKLVPMVEYVVHRAGTQSFQNGMSRDIGRKTVNWTEIPQDIRDLIKQDYAAIKIGEPRRLPFPNLGVEALLNGDGDIGVPTGYTFGESMIFKIQDDLITYELASSYLIRDMYNGKGIVYLPKNLSMGDIPYDPNIMLRTETPTVNPMNQDGRSINGDVHGNVNAIVMPPVMPRNPLSGMPDQVETLKGVSPEDQQAIVQQFELRVQEWQTVKENCLKNIATKWGMSPKILNSFLAVGQVQQTATQVDSEDDISIAFINLTRSYFKDKIDKLMETSLNYMGIATNIKIDFASPSLINKDRILQRVSNLRQEGFIDTEEAIRELNPDLDEEELQSRIEKAKQQEMQMMMAKMQPPMDDELGGGNGDLDGTTII